jgi:hypothetical protein
VREPPTVKESTVRLNPRSRDVRIRVLRSNPVGGFTVAEIVALSKYPGKGPAQPRIKQAMAEASRQIKDSTFFLPKELRKKGPPDHYDEWELFPYQVAGVAYVLEQAAKGQRRTAIFDPMGLGKTAQGVGAVLALGMDSLPAVVVAPLSAHNAWRTAFGVFSKLPVHETFPKAGSSGRAVYLVTYDRIREFSKGTPEDLGYLNPRMVIFDEAHMAGNPDSAQAKGAGTLIGVAKYSLLLTGTPALQSAFDVMPLLRMLDMKAKPFASHSDYLLAAESWAEDRRIPTVKRGQRRLLVSPADGVQLEDDLRKVAARRSRRSVVSARAAPEKFLQNLKTRKAILVPAFSGRYHDLSEEKLRELMSRQSAQGGLEDFAALDNALKRYHRLLMLLASSSRSADDLFEKSQTRALTKRGELVPLRQEWEEDHSPKGATLPFSAVLTQARRAYLPIPAGAASERDEASNLRQQMGLHVIPRAVEYQAAHPDQDVVFVVFYQNTADRLGEALARTGKGRKLYIYAGHKKGTFNPNGVYRSGVQRPDGKRVGEKDVAQALELLFKRRRGKGRTVILSGAAMTGLSLPSADKLVFLDRFASPGQEDQMEDRINRAGRTGNPEIVYLIPEDIWGSVLAHRLSNRRASIFSAFGEKFAGIRAVDDKQAMKEIGDDYATPLGLPDMTRRIRALRRLKTPEAEAQADVLENTQFIEDPIGNLRKMAARAYRPVAESARAHREAASRATRERERQHQEAQAALSSQPTTQMSKFLHDIGAGKLTWWVIERRRGQKVFAVTADWPESNEEWVINVKGTVIPVEDTNWDSTDEAVTSPTDLTEAQRNRLLEMGYERQGIKFNPSRRRPRRRPRWRRRDRWQ